MTILERAQPSVGANLHGGDAFKRLGGPVPDFASDPEEEQPQTYAQGTWMKLAREAFEFSTTYVDSNYRKLWDDGIRAFNNQHGSDSKYNSPSFAKRSNIFRPKTRAVIRKNEAAAATAFFSTTDVIQTEPEDQSNPMQRASADVMKIILEYRLKKSLHWFQIVQGGFQDAQTVGVAIARTDWLYIEGKQDRPDVCLIPAENIRIDPGSDWMDPVNTSPYIIELIPMYVGDVVTRMEVPDKMGNTWNRHSKAQIALATQDQTDSTRAARNKSRTDPLDPDGQSISDYEIVWVQRHIHRKDGRDWHFYTLGDVAMLTDAVPLEQVVFHGERPYVMGTFTLETHKIMASGVPELTKGLQEETNEIANQRLDNIKFVLNKRWIVRRGKNVDLASLVRNVPGGITMADDVEADIKEVNWPDVTASAYQEQDRINADFDDLMGNFSPGSVQTNRKLNETVRGMGMLQQSGAVVVEYGLRIYVETFVLPLLRQLTKLIQRYETDEVILALAAKKAKLLQKYGIDKVTDQLLDQELTLTVNVGMGASDPMTRLQKFGQGLAMMQGITEKPIPGLNVAEVSKEIFGLTGYQDGQRFFSDEDPEKAMLKQNLQQAGHVIQELGRRVEDKEADRQTQKDIAHEGNVTKLIIEDKKMDHESKHKVVDIIHEHAKMDTEHMLQKQMKIADMAHSNDQADAQAENAHRSNVMQLEDKKRERKESAGAAVTQSRKDDKMITEKQMTQITKTLGTIEEKTQDSAKEVSEAVKELTKIVAELHKASAENRKLAMSLMADDKKSA